jgi:hypothetical protein
MAVRWRLVVAAVLAVLALPIVAATGTASAQETTGCSAELASTLSLARGFRAFLDFPVELPAGTYTVDATSEDSYEGRENVPPQPGERWRVLFLAGGQVVASTPSTPDLEDLVPQAIWTGRLATVTLDQAVDTVRAEHQPSDATDGLDSVRVSRICVSPAQGSTDLGAEAQCVDDHVVVRVTNPNTVPETVTASRPDAPPVTTTVPAGGEADVDLGLTPGQSADVTLEWTDDAGAHSVVRSVTAPEPCGGNVEPVSVAAVCSGLQAFVRVSNTTSTDLEVTVSREGVAPVTVTVPANSSVDVDLGPMSGPTEVQLSYTDPTEASAAAVTTAIIDPDPECITPLVQVDLQVSAECDGENVVAVLTNPNADAVDATVTRSGVAPVTVTVPAGGSIDVDLGPADTGGDDIAVTWADGSAATTIDAGSCGVTAGGEGDITVTSVCRDEGPRAVLTNPTDEPVTATAQVPGQAPVTATIPAGGSVEVDLGLVDGGPVDVAIEWTIDGEVHSVTSTVDVECAETPPPTTPGAPGLPPTGSTTDGLLNAGLLLVAAGAALLLLGRPGTADRSALRRG